MRCAFVNAVACMGLLAAVVASQRGATAQEEGDRRKAVEGYYARWIGVEAPEFGPEVVERNNGPKVRLKALRGKRVFLLSFDAGDFNRAPDEKVLLETLRAMDRARKAAGPEKLMVVGFTQGMMFVWPGVGKPPGELGKLSEFPIVSVINRRFPEPYKVLLRPGAILIDSKGLIRAIVPHELTPKEIADTAALGDWDRPARPAPIDDPWMGKGPPKPAREIGRIWSCPLRDVIGLTAGDWDLDGGIDVIAATTKEIVLLGAEDGAIGRRIKAAEDTLPQPNRIGLFTVQPTVELLWAEIKKGQTALLPLQDGWPHSLPVLGAKGAVLWKFESDDAIDSAAWADLRGDGEKDLLVGFNVFGVKAVDAAGHPRWQAEAEGSVYAVAGIDARGGRPGLVLYSARGRVHILDARGRELKVLPNEGHEVIHFAPAELDGAGTRQVLAVWPAIVGPLDFAVATDLDGKVLWKYPVDYEKLMILDKKFDVVDLDGDGASEWVLATGRGEVAVLDARGRLVARLETTGKRWTSWSVVPRAGKPGWIVVADAGHVEAYGLAPSK